MTTATTPPLHQDVSASLDDLARELDRADRSIRNLILVALGICLAMVLMGLATQIMA